MITLKSKIVKSEFLKQAKIQSNKRFEYENEPHDSIDVFLAGVKYTLNELQLKNK